MNVESAYNQWSEIYDQMANKTRDLEALSLREILDEIKFESVLEIGCGTGKNTAWFAEKASNVLAIDLSDEMLAKAKEKIQSPKVNFQKADITQPWDFTGSQKFDLISFSLVLEHISDLTPIFEKINSTLNSSGYVYIGELHSFKQYNGTKARFETGNGVEIVDCFDHHISDFVQNGLKQGFKLLKLEEYFDDNNRTGLPRILGLLFQK